MCHIMSCAVRGLQIGILPEASTHDIPWESRNKSPKSLPFADSMQQIKREAQNAHRFLCESKSENKIPHGRDSRFSRLGTETPRLSVQVSSRNRTRNRLQAKRGLGISLGTETMKLQVSVSEPESGYTASCMKTPQKVLLYGKKLSFFPESEPKCRDSR